MLRESYPAVYSTNIIVKLAGQLSRRMIFFVNIQPLGYVFTIENLYLFRNRNNPH
jgi:hypothetical protein